MNDGSSRVGIVGVLVALLVLAQGSIVPAADNGNPQGPASGKTVIKGTWIWNIERDKLGDRQEGHDLWWRHSSTTERYLCSLNSAKIAVVKGKKWEEVDQAFLASCELSDMRIPGSDNDNQLTPGTILAVRTIAGNLAKLKVLGYRPHENGIANYDLELEWVIYRGAPPAIPAPVPAPSVSLPGGTATLTVRVIEGEATLARGPTVTVQAADHTLFTPVARVENPAVFALPPGKYQVTARVGAGLETVPRLVTLGGQPIELVLRTGTGTLELKLTAGGKPMRTIGQCGAPRWAPPGGGRVRYLTAIPGHGRRLHGSRRVGGRVLRQWAALRRRCRPDYRGSDHAACGRRACRRPDRQGQGDATTVQGSCPTSRSTPAGNW